MGLRTMELVDFMVKQCQWTMVTCNTGNYGRKGDQREQQLVFRNDEFVQHGVDHLMVELRTVGYIEINGLHDAEDLKPHLIDFLTTQWGCSEYTAWFWESDERFGSVCPTFCVWCIVSGPPLLLPEVLRQCIPPKFPHLRLNTDGHTLGNSPKGEGEMR